MIKVNRSFFGVCLLMDIHCFTDERGGTIKPYHSTSFQLAGISETFKEDLIVTSHKHVLRGMHFQRPPYAQGKLICCIRGAARDVVVDIRPASQTRGHHAIVELSEDRPQALYIPAGFAHGYLSLEDNTTLFYKMTSEYAPQHESGIRWDSLGIDWGTNRPIVSERDKGFGSMDTVDGMEEGSS